MIEQEVSTQEPVLVVGIREPRASRYDMEHSLRELCALIDTAGGEVAEIITQELKTRSSATLIHRGKVEEIAERGRALACETIVIDAELSPAQQRNLSEAWQCKVLDRTAVILDIFAGRAQTQAGKLQVELAQLEYRLPRLAGSRTDLMQQAGHIGTRGPGETRLEIDRRRIHERIARLKQDIAVLAKQRETQRAQRKRAGVPVVALVGYTNAGKSTLLNALSKAEVLAEDKLFATLDPTARRVTLPSKRTVIVVDTVGFISHLPHQLVAAFKGTFEEALHADVLLHVMDAASPHAAREQSVVCDVLSDLGASDVPVIEVLNKCDLLESMPESSESRVAISAQEKRIDALLRAIDTALHRDLVECTLVIPHSEGALLAKLHREGQVLEVKHGADGVTVRARVPGELLGRLEKFRKI